MGERAAVGQPEIEVGDRQDWRPPAPIRNARRRLVRARAREGLVEGGETIYGRAEVGHADVLIDEEIHRRC